MSTFTVHAGLSAPRRRAPRPVPSTRNAPARPAQLTRRGRLLLSALTLVLFVAGAVLASGGGLASAGTEPSSPSASTAERVTVRPGETLWAIAQREVPGVDPRETIARILDLNALQSSTVRAGSVLLIPGR
jgi:Tfp pilus assembly protein FimV